MDILHSSPALALLCVLLLALPCSGDASLWLSDSTHLPSFGKQADRHLERSDEALRELVDSAGKLSPTLFSDLHAWMGISNEAGLLERCYEVIEATNRAEQRLETARAELQLAQDTADNRAEFDRLVKPDALRTYHAIKAQIRLSQSLAKAMVARKMAALGNRSYAMQAMESAIDSLQIAVKSAEQSGGTLRGQKTITPPFLTALRAYFLAEWERAQTKATLDPMLRFSPGLAVREAAAAHADPVAERALAWLSR